MGYTLGLRSRQNLSGVHPDMVAVVTRALELSKQDFSITEGIRHIDRQKELVKTGKSTTLNSRHLTGHAVDVVPYPVSWDWEYFHPIAEAMEKAEIKSKRGSRSLRIKRFLDLSWDVKFDNSFTISVDNGAEEIEDCVADPVRDEVEAHSEVMLLAVKQLPGLQTFELMYSERAKSKNCLLYTSPSPRDRTRTRMPSSA